MLGSYFLTHPPIRKFRVDVHIGPDGLSEASGAWVSAVVPPCSRLVVAAVVPGVDVPGEGLPRRPGTTAY